MSPVSLFLNVLWIVFGGFWMAACWFVAGVLMILTVVTLPWAGAAFRIGWYTMLPFGQTVVPRAACGYESPGGLFGLIGNIIWLLLAGWWLALAHLATAAALALTLIGAPFAWAHLKLALLALWPIGQMVVTVEEAEGLRRAGSRR